PDYPTTLLPYTTLFRSKALSWTGFVWDLGEPPAEVVRNERRVGTAVLEKVSRQLAEHFPPGTVSAQIASAREAVAAHPKVVELRDRKSTRLNSSHVKIS